VRAAKLRADPLCEMCRHEGRVAEAKTVDHIKRIADGGAPFDPDNMRSLCIDHHKQRHGAKPKGGRIPRPDCRWAITGGMTRKILA
jgi:5-methylcytosine-specific restriction endonuclease McrA